MSAKCMENATLLSRKKNKQKTNQQKTDSYQLLTSNSLLDKTFSITWSQFIYGSLNVRL